MFGVFSICLSTECVAPAVATQTKKPFTEHCLCDCIDRITIQSSTMETALLGLALPDVLEKLKEMLLRKGFVVQTLNSSVVIAHQEGNWLRKARQLVFEISTVNKNVTRIDITAIINTNKNSRQEEELIEETYASAIYNNFTNILQPHGIR